MQMLQLSVVAGKAGAVAVLQQRNTFTANGRTVTAEVSGIFIIQGARGVRCSSFCGAFWGVNRPSMLGGIARHEWRQDCVFELYRR